MTDNTPRSGSNLLLFALLDLLDISDEPAMAQAIGKLKEVISKMDPYTSHNLLRMKMKALLKVRDDLFLKIQCPVPEETGRPGKAQSKESNAAADSGGQRTTSGDPKQDVQATISNYLEQLLEMLETTNNTSETFQENLDEGIAKFKEVKKVKKIQDMANQMISSATDMVEATNVFQAGIGEMAALVYDFQHKITKLESELEQQREIALADPLTGVNNRRAFDLRLEETLAHSKRFHTPMVLLLMDMDKFKYINDTYGHDVGDEVLISFARLLRTSCREYDMVFRFGGDEFAVILPNEAKDEGVLFANRIEKFMRNNAYRLGDKKLHMSISGGLAELKEDDTGFSLFRRADERLLAAKKAGRARVVAEDD